VVQLGMYNLRRAPRCYRAVRNKKLDISDLGPLFFTLRTMRDGMPEQVVVKRPVSSITVRVIPSGCDCDGNRMSSSDAAQIEYRSPSESETPAQPVQEILPPEPEPETIDEAIAPNLGPSSKTNSSGCVRERSTTFVQASRSI
jgi:hypothetical protein